MQTPYERYNVNTAYQSEHTIYIEKHSGRILMQWGFFSLVMEKIIFRVDAKMAIATYRTILEASMLEVATELGGNLMCSIY